VGAVGFGPTADELDATNPHQPKNQPERAEKTQIEDGASKRRWISQERAKGLRSESPKPSPRHQPHPPTHYEPSGFVPEPPAFELRARGA